MTPCWSVSASPRPQEINTHIPDSRSPGLAPVKRRGLEMVQITLCGRLPLSLGFHGLHLPGCFLGAEEE